MTKKVKAKKRPIQSKKTSKLSTKAGKQSIWPFIAIIAIVAVVALWPVIQADFTELDDKRLILEKIPIFQYYPQNVWHFSLYTAHYKPLVILSWVMEANMYGFNPVGFHAVNLFFHICNSILAFFLALALARQFKITKKQPEIVALFAALFFAVHPMHVESVAWAMGRKDLFYTFFFLLGLLAYLRHLKTPSIKWMAIVATCFVGSILSKAPSIMFPFILLILDFAYRKDLNIKSVVSKWPVFLVLILGLSLYGVFGGGSWHTSSGATEGRITKLASTAPVTSIEPISSFPTVYAKTALIGLKGVFWYVHSFLPVKLALAYPYKHWLTKIGHMIHIFPIMLALSAFLVFRSRKKYRFLFFTHAFFFLAMTPAIIRTGLGTGIFLSDRYVYLGIFGLLLFVSGGLTYLMQRKGWSTKQVFASLGSITLLLSIMSFTTARKWDNGETLWTSNIEYYPQISYAFSNRGLYYQETGQQDKAMADFNSAAELGDDLHALIGRSTMLRKEGRYEEALADLNRLLAKKPNDPYAINGKANVLFAMGNYQDAVTEYSRGLANHGNDVALLANRAASYFYLRQYDAAVVDLERAIKVNSDYPGLYSKMVVVYSGMGDWQNVVKYGNLYAEQAPKNHANLGDLAMAYQQLGQHQEAINAYTRAINVNPRGKRYYLGRAKSYDAIGYAQEAQNDMAMANSL